jgi:hypothetical protein
MLRWLVLALVAANLIFFVWTQGWLDEVTGLRARGDSEPARLNRQVRPESVIILPPEGAGPVSPVSPADTTTPVPGTPPGPTSSSANPAGGGATSTSVSSSATTNVGGGGSGNSPGPVCLEAGPFTPAQFTAAVAALQAIRPALPPGSWIDVRREKPAVWMVYMGRYPNREALERKQEELRRVRGAVFEEVRDIPELSPGFSLGRFDQRVKAEQALEALALRGLRTARVVQAEAPVVTHTLRADKLVPELATQYAAVQFAGSGRRFAPCSTS